MKIKSITINIDKKDWKKLKKQAKKLRNTTKNKGTSAKGLIFHIIKNGIH